MKTSVLIPFLLTALLCTPGEANEIVRIGINAEDISILNSAFVEKTKKAIKAELENSAVSFEEVGPVRLKKLVETRQVDLVLSSSMFFRQMLHRGARDLVTLVSPQAEDPTRGVGAVVLTDAVNTGNTLLKDLANKKVLVTTLYGRQSPTAFYGELVSSGIDSKNFDIEERQLSVKDCLRHLEKGIYDSVVLPVCLLEEYVLESETDTSWIKPVNRKSHTSLLCLHSTELYPNLTLFSLPHASSEVVRKITSSLTALAEPKGHSWSITSDYSPTDRLLKKLNLDADAETRKWTLQRVLRDYWQWFMVFAFFLVGLMIHSVRAEYLVKKRTFQLEKAFQKQSKLHQEAKLAAKRIERLQKVGTIGQMSALFAHELRQPLNSIICFAYSLAKSPFKGSEEDLKEGLEEIGSQAKRANEIVTKVRNYVRSQSSAQTDVDVLQIIQKAVREFESTSSNQMEIKVLSNERPQIKGDPLELELIIINLLRNAEEAQGKVDKAFVEISVEQANNQCILTFKDNGPKADENTLMRVKSRLESSKPEGLGLGLSIVYSLVEAHNGEIKFSANEDRGLTVSLYFPLSNE